jgi:hypothetical protein
MRALWQIEATLKRIHQWVHNFSEEKIAYGNPVPCTITAYGAPRSDTTQAGIGNQQSLATAKTDYLSKNIILTTHIDTNYSTKAATR